jgi:hypothetical protein
VTFEEIAAGPEYLRGAAHHSKQRLPSRCFRFIRVCRSGQAAAAHDGIGRPAGCSGNCCFLFHGPTSPGGGGRERELPRRILFRRATSRFRPRLTNLRRCGTTAVDNHADTYRYGRYVAPLLKPESSNPRTPDDSTDDAAALRQIQLALREVLRHRSPVAVPHRQITLEFDHGIIAQCVRCHVMWRVSRAHYPMLSWWCCPSGCNHQGG